MRKILSTTFFRGWAVGAALSVSVGATQAAVINGGFETGDFTGWSTIGIAGIDTGDLGIGVPGGSHQAFLSTGEDLFGVTGASDFDIELFLGLTPGSLDSVSGGDAIEGSAIAQTMTLSAGDILSFDWNFLTNEGSSSFFNDFAFGSLSVLGADVLGDTFSPLAVSLSPFFDDETGFATESFVIPFSGTFVLGLGVMDSGDDFMESALVVDNVSIRSDVSEPAGLSLLGIGLAGIGLIRRRRKVCSRAVSA